MKKIGFIGAYDKSDLMLYVAKILVEVQKKVLIVDATTLQKTKYTIPTIFPVESYLTNFEGIDIAVGFYDYFSLQSYLGISSIEELEYDYIFFNIDTPEAMKDFELQTADKNYFVTGFDLYSLKRGLEILSVLTEPIPMTKLLFSKNITQMEDDYLNNLSLGCKVIWEEEKLYFPFEQGDGTAVIENQLTSKIRFKRLSKFYKESLIYIANQLLEDTVDANEFKKALIRLEKGV